MFHVVVSNRYGRIMAYICHINPYEVEYKGFATTMYKVDKVIYGINVPERVGRNAYPYKDDGIEDLNEAQKLCIVKLFKLK